MASTTKVPLGGATLNRKYYCDVNSGTYAAPTWVGIFGVTEFKAGKEPTLNDDSDFDAGGWHSKNITALAWSLEMKVERKVTAGDATVYDPGQELLRAASDGMGTSNVIDVRWYEITSSGPKVEAYRGFACVSWSPEGGDMTADDIVSVTLDGRGARAAITHPDFALVVPSVYSITPATDVAAGGALVTIAGMDFFAAGADDVTAITFGVAAAVDWVAYDDNAIIVVVPAVAAGSVNVTVTNATGVSTDTVAFLYT